MGTLPVGELCFGISSREPQFRSLEPLPQRSGGTVREVQLLDGVSCRLPLVL